MMSHGIVCSYSDATFVANNYLKLIQEYCGVFQQELFKLEIISCIGERVISKTDEIIWQCQ